MSNRRSFIRQTAAMLGGLALHQNVAAAFPEISNQKNISPDDPDFWRKIRQEFSVNPNLINLNNAGISPAPRASQDALDHFNRMCNEVPSYYMWRILDQQREPLRENLAKLAGVETDEIAINRNATEALNSVIFGLDLKPGDEVVLSKYDYPNMMHAWRQREKRDGIKLVWVDLELPSEDEKYFVEAYSTKFSEKTRVVHLTHLINWTGQVLPVRKIADRARQAIPNIEILVDGAQTFGHLDFKIPDLNCDYFGTSMHKWLCAPFGNGLLWMKKEKIAKIWPLLGADLTYSENIRKFENLGTRSFPAEMATGYSLELHNLIGSKRKNERLFYLKNYWMERVKDLPGIKIYTPTRPKFSGAIGNFGFEGKKANDLVGKLFNDYKIHTTGIEWEKVNGVRVSPNVYTLESELDKLVGAIEKISKT